MDFTESNDLSLTLGVLKNHSNNDSLKRPNPRKWSCEKKFEFPALREVQATNLSNMSHLLPIKLLKRLNFSAIKLSNYFLCVFIPCGDFQRVKMGFIK